MNYDKDMGVLGALPKAVDGEFARGVEAAANTDDLISFLTDGEGDTVTFCCSNPDFNGLPNECVSVNAMWTNWIDRDFRADTRRDCLLAAVHAMKEAAQFGSEALILLPASVGMEKDNEDRSFAALIEAQASVPLQWFDGLEMALNTLTPENDHQFGMMDGARSLIKDARNFAKTGAGTSELVSTLSKRDARSSSQSSEKSAGLGGRDPIDDLIDIPKGEEFR